MMAWARGASSCEDAPAQAFRLLLVVENHAGGRRRLAAR